MNKINWKMGKKTGNQKLDNPPFLEMGESAEVEFYSTTTYLFGKF